MLCRICGREGANSAGFHPPCFMESVNRNTGTHSRTVFSGSGVKRESTDGPRTEEDWLQFQARVKAEEDERRRENERAQQEAQQKADEERRQRQQKEQRRYYTYSDFSDFFGRQGRTQHAPDTPRESESVQITIDRVRLKQLLLLCHPDKHSNSERASEVTRWLIGIKERMS